MTHLSVLLAVILTLLSSPQRDDAVHVDGLEALTAPNAVMCTTAPVGRVWRTNVVWADGSTTRYTNLRITQRLFEGARVYQRPARRANMPVVRRCNVRGNVVRQWTTGGAKVITRQVPPTTPVAPVAEQMPVPTGPSPVVTNRWVGPITLYSPLGADWHVTEAVAAWNTALPTDQQITVTVTPCEQCIMLSEVPTITVNTEWWGAAFAYHNPGVVEHCRIELASVIPAEYRSIVTSHEIGHCLGLSHWEFAGSIMTAEASMRWITDGLPTRYDREWVSNAYATTP